MNFLFDANSTIYNEREIYLEDNRKFIIDKLILSNNGKTYILDYKTGEEDQKHLKQVSEYIIALENAGYKDCTGYLLYIPSMTLLEV